MASTLLGCLTLTLFALNTVLWATPFYVVTLLKILLPAGAWRQACSRALIRLAEGWIGGNGLIIRVALRTVWDVELPAGLRPDGSYLVISNHRSAIDIPALQKVFNQKIPFLKFFLKRQLLYVPVLGIAWWALDFPFMRRYSRQLLERRPELRGRDLESLRRVCQRFRGRPVSILNFLEGTRFSPQKRERYDSPYRHLLPPRAGGIAGALAALGPELHGIVNVTLLYSDPAIRFWDFFCGRLRRVVLRAELIGVPPWLAGKDYGSDPEYRKAFQDWVNTLWREKDEAIEELLRRPS